MCHAPGLCGQGDELGVQRGVSLQRMHGHVASPAKWLGPFSFSAQVSGGTGFLVAGLSRNVVLTIVVQEEDGEESTRNDSLIHDGRPKSVDSREGTQALSPALPSPGHTRPPCHRVLVPAPRLLLGHLSGAHCQGGWRVNKPSQAFLLMDRYFRTL